MRKGLALPTMMSILAVIVSIMFLSISSDMVLQPEEYIRENSVFVVSERVSSAVYAMDSVERADMEIALGAEYDLETDPGESVTYIGYGENRRAIEPGIPYTSETGNSTVLCVTKNPSASPRIKPGEC